MFTILIMEFNKPYRLYSFSSACQAKGILPRKGWGRDGDSIFVRACCKSRQGAELEACLICELDISWWLWCWTLCGRDTAGCSIPHGFERMEAPQRWDTLPLTAFVQHGKLHKLLYLVAGCWQPTRAEPQGDERACTAVVQRQACTANAGCFYWSRSVSTSCVLTWDAEQQPIHHALEAGHLCRHRVCWVWLPSWTSSTRILQAFSSILLCTGGVCSPWLQRWHCNVHREAVAMECPSQASSSTCSFCEDFFQEGEV